MFATVVNTVRGPVNADDLGPVLMHEHILIATPGIKENWPALWDRDACLDTARETFAAIEATGFHTFVDVTTADMGRDINLLQALQETTAINIVAATGIYWNVPPYWQGRSADAMAAAFIGEIEDGIAGTTVRAGIIKVAIHLEFTPIIEACLRAAARTHRATGVPITTHAYPQEMGRIQQRIFRDEGVDLTRVVIGHQGAAKTPADIAYYKELMDAGSVIGVDQFGIDEYPGRDLQDTAGRAALVAQLCADGYSDRIVLSQDAHACADWGIYTQFPPGFNPDWSHLHLGRTVLPLLRDVGVPEIQIRQMTIENPRRIFQRQEPYPTV
jgi:phosphotriesterase-related protein